MYASYVYHNTIITFLQGEEGEMGIEIWARFSVALCFLEYWKRRRFVAAKF